MKKIWELEQGVLYERQHVYYMINEWGVLMGGLNKDKLDNISDFNYEFEEVKLPFPQYGDECWVPDFTRLAGCGYFYYNPHDELQQRLKRVVGLYETSEEALDKAKELGWIE